MKKYGVAVGVVAVIAVYLVMNLFFPLDSYYFDIDDARSKEGKCQSFYREHDYMFTLEKEKEIADILIADQRLCIVEIDIKNKLNKPSYYVKGFISTPIGQYIQSFREDNAYHWKNTGLLFSAHSFQWCIVSKTFNLENDNLEAFEFTYEGELYCLCYRETSAN